MPVDLASCRRAAIVQEARQVGKPGRSKACHFSQLPAIVQQAAGEATLRLLRQFGQEVDVLDNCCCGLPALSYGDIEVARNLSGKNLQTLDVDRYDVIVTDCSSCASFLKKYPTLYTEGDPLLIVAEGFAAKMRKADG